MAEQWSPSEEREPRPSPSMQPEPQPEPELEREAGSSSSGVGKWIFGALVGVALLAGIGGYSTGVFSPAPEPQSAPAVATVAAPAQQGFSMLQKVAAADQSSALQKLVMSDAEKAKVAKAVQNGSAQLATLALSDSGTEDGDIITISGAGFSQTVPLLKKQTVLVVPYAPGAPIRVFATKDGFDPGVTVAVYVGGSVFKLRSMKEGETIEIASP